LARRVVLHLSLSNWFFFYLEVKQWELFDLPPGATSTLVSCFTAGKKNKPTVRPPHSGPSTRVKTQNYSTDHGLAAREAKPSRRPCPGTLVTASVVVWTTGSEERRVRTRLRSPAVHGSIAGPNTSPLAIERTTQPIHPGCESVTASPLLSARIAGLYLSGKRQHRSPTWKGEARLGSEERRVGAPWVSTKKILVFSSMNHSGFWFRLYLDLHALSS